MFAIKGNDLCTSVHYKPTDSQLFVVLIFTSITCQEFHSFNSQFLRCCRLCNDDSNFSIKSEEMCQFFEKHSYPTSVVQTGHHHTQQIDRQSALQMSQKEKNDRIPFILTFHPRNHAVKSIILKNFKLLQNDPKLVPKNLFPTSVDASNVMSLNVIKVL